MPWRGSSLNAWRWPIVFIILFTGVLYTINHWVNTAVQTFTPSVSNTTIVQTSVTRLQKEVKIIVLSADVTVEVTRTSSKILWERLDFGDTVATIRSRGNRAQYFISFDKISENDFRLSNNNRSLTVLVPEPRVDEDIIEVQSDPDRIEIKTEVGWGRLDQRSGELARTEAKRGLRDAVISEAKAPVYMDLARHNARQKVSDLLSPLVTQLGVTNLAVEFRKP